MALSVEELAELEDNIMAELPDAITEILSRTNRSGQLEDLLELLKMEHLLQPTEKIDTYKEGKIVVIGGSDVKEKDLLSIAKSLGIEKSRFEFCLDYEKVQKYDFRKFQYAPQYRVILFGQVPHSGTGKKDSGSIVAEIEKGAEYPRVERLISNQTLKITKTNFREKLEALLEENYI